MREPVVGNEQGIWGGLLRGLNNHNGRRPEQNPENRNRFALPAARDLFGGIAGRLEGPLQALADPRVQRLLQALGRVNERNPELGALLCRIGMDGNFNLDNLRQEEMQLILGNLDLLQESGMLDLIRNDINDQRLEAFLRLRERNKQVADSLGQLFIRLTTNRNLNLNDLTNDEILLIANNISLMEETGLLQALQNDLPPGFQDVLRFRTNNPWLFNRLVDLGNTFPCLIDWGKGVAESPARGYFTAATTLLGGVGLGVLCFCKLSLLCAIPAFLPAVAIGAVLGFAIGALLSCKPVTQFLGNVWNGVCNVGKAIGNFACDVGRGIGNFFSKLKFW